jgi:hypothetical protein
MRRFPLREQRYVLDVVHRQYGLRTELDLHRPSDLRTPELLRDDGGAVRRIRLR